MSENLLLSERGNDTARCLDRIRLRYFRYEADLHNLVKDHLAQSQIPYCHEYVFDEKNRVDFLVFGTVAVEVKIGKQDVAKLSAQLARYAEFDLVTDVILLMERNLLHRIELSKPFLSISLSTKSWLS